MMVFEYTFSRKRIADSPAKVGAPRDTLPVLQKLIGGGEQERMAVLWLDTRNHLIGAEVVYVGNVSAALVRVGELFRGAVRVGASALILAHQHPSGDATPSPDDLHLTAEAVAAGRLLDIDVLDHIVLGEGDSFVSLRDRGVAFDRRPGGHGVGEAPTEMRPVLRVENGQIVDDDGQVYVLREAIEHIPWVTAKKYAPRHEYSILGRGPVLAWDVLACAIREHPDSYLGLFRGYLRAMRYLEIDDRRYWRTSSANPGGGLTSMLNRCLLTDVEPPRRVDQGAKPISDWQGPRWLPEGSAWPLWYPLNPRTNMHEYDAALDPFRRRRRANDSDQSS